MLSKVKTVLHIQFALQKEGEKLSYLVVKRKLSARYSLVLFEATLLEEIGVTAVMFDLGGNNLGLGRGSVERGSFVAGLIGNGAEESSGLGRLD